MGSYNFSSPGPYDEQDQAYSQIRDQARQRLADLVAPYGQAGKNIYAANQALANQAKYKADTNVGGTVARDAMLGAPFGGYGAAIGAGVGLLTQGVKGYNARRKHGEGRMHAFLDTVNPVNLVSDALSSTSAAPAAAALGGMYQGAQSRQGGAENYLAQRSAPSAGNVGTADSSGAPNSFQFSSGNTDDYNDRLLETMKQRSMMKNGGYSGDV